MVYWTPAYAGATESNVSGWALLRALMQICYPSCLSFPASSVLHKGLHTTSMRPFVRLEETAKSGAIGTTYLRQSP